MFTQWTGLLPRRFVDEVSGVCRRAARLTLFVGELALWTLVAAGSPGRARELPRGALVLARRAFVRDEETRVRKRTARRALTGRVGTGPALLLLGGALVLDVVAALGRFARIEAFSVGVLSGITGRAFDVRGAARE